MSVRFSLPSDILNIPRFTGDFTCWDEFWDEFKRNVHDKPYEETYKTILLSNICKGYARQFTENFDYTRSIESLQSTFHRWRSAYFLCIAIERVPEAGHNCDSLFWTLSEIRRLVKVLRRYETSECALLRQNIEGKFPQELMREVRKKRGYEGANSEWTTEELLNEIENSIVLKSRIEAFREIQKENGTTKL